MGFKKRKKVSFIFGTRPEAIKLAPIIMAMRDANKITHNVAVTGQHRDMLGQALKIFRITPHLDMNLMEENQSPVEFVGKSIHRIHSYLSSFEPDLVVVQGDTGTTFCASLAAFYCKIPIAYVESGLRTGDKYSPYPEEVNRILTSHLADIHFAPTKTAMERLVAEGIPADKISVTGNTVLDALKFIQEEKLTKPFDIRRIPVFKKEMVLITAHRRENFGVGLEHICKAIKNLAHNFPEVDFVYPVHLNPNVLGTVNSILKKSARMTVAKNVHLLPPIDYVKFIYLMEKASLILTDSGGMQEEATALGKPLLIMRDNTERSEVIEFNLGKLIGTNTRNIVDNVSAVLDNKLQFSKCEECFGDGKAALKILTIITNFFQDKRTNDDCKLAEERTAPAVL